ncbi:MAG: hypothetical protein KKB75_09285 [Alphaproteobacteria bacterium]|nr:hypothetical protein [Alphaproteobacteria bacterium]MBU2142405.1 hypothetical protein [Alphaproteobacteria bacterium]MBU2196866.1 hypothetical protein [Alphaproteobacteria bacterium]
MSRLGLLLLSALLCAGAASAVEDPPESCRPKVAGTALALAGDAERAQMQCDIDRAAQLVARSDRRAATAPRPVVRVVDTASPSGTAYIYDVIGALPNYWLEARNVPSDEGERTRVPVCTLGTNIPADVSQLISHELKTAASQALPEYGAREDIQVNPDGSKRVILLLDTHDIITTVETEAGTRHFSRHARASDEIARLNQTIIGVANFSDSWVCNAN